MADILRVIHKVNPSINAHNSASTLVESPIFWLNPLSHSLVESQTKPPPLALLGFPKMNHLYWIWTTHQGKAYQGYLDDLEAFNHTCSSSTRHEFTCWLGNNPAETWVWVSAFKLNWTTSNNVLQFNINKDVYLVMVFLFSFNKICGDSIHTHHNTPLRISKAIRFSLRLVLEKGIPTTLKPYSNKDPCM